MSPPRTPRVSRRPSDRGAGSGRDSAAPVRRGVEEVVAALREDIVSLRYLEHDRLPAERRLAERFETARNTVRGALDRLESTGLVERRRGSGTYVRHSEFVEMQSVVRSTGPLQLIDARLAVEPHVASLAALHASGHTVHQLSAALRKVGACECEEDGFSASDEDFHTAVAACTQNEMLIWICKWVNRVRGHEQWTEMKHLTLTPKRIVAYNLEHQDIYTAIRRRDSEGAARAAREHLLSARESLVNAGLRG